MIGAGSFIRMNAPFITDEEKDRHYLVPSRRRKLVGCMFWGCITYNGTATLTPVSGNINGEK